MKLFGTIIFVYAVILLIGGTAAYLESAGIVTFITAVVSGIILVLSSGIIKKGSFIGVYISLFVSLSLGVFFGLKFSKFNNIMPDGILTIISMFAIGYSVYTLSNKEQYSKNNP